MHRLAFFGLLLSAFACGIVRAKVKVTFAAIDGIKPFVGCDVCHAMVDAAVEFRDELKANCTRDGTRMTEDKLIEVAVEPLCNPHTEGGDWLRRVDWTVDADGAVTFDFKNEFGRCKAKCTTAAEICRHISDSDDADGFAALLLRGSTSSKIQKAICTGPCRASDQAVKRAKAKKNAALPSWGAEAFEPIDHQEKEIEEMMERMTIDRKSGPGTQVFSRKEMSEVKAAMAAGDLDRLQELDPSTFADIDEEEFAAWQQMSNDMGARQEDQRDVSETAGVGGGTQTDGSDSADPPSWLDRIWSLMPSWV